MVRPKDRLLSWQWAEKHIVVDKTSPMPGAWRSENSPWVREVMECFADNNIQVVCVECSAQSAKTQTFLNCALYAISEDPGPMMWVMAAGDEAKTFSKTRLMPTIEQCKALKDILPTGRSSKTTLEINFPTMPFIMNGANAPSKLQSKPVRWLFLDEVRNYPPGALEMVKKRTTAFWNSRTVIISTPDKKNDAMDMAFKSGDQREWFFDCPQCKQQQALVLSQFKWETNEKTKPNKYNFDALAETIYLECISCNHRIKDTPSERRWICDNGRYVAQNLNAPQSKVSFHWNAFLPPWIRWSQLIEEFITGTEVMKRGDIEPLKSFINERLGEPWDEEKNQIGQRMVLKTSEYLFAEVDRKFCDFRFFTVDVQMKELWGVIRDWKKDGESKLVWAGQIQTWGEVVQLQRKYEVNNWDVFVDSGFDAAEVYIRCLENGWVALKGDEREKYFHSRNGKKPRAKIFSEKVRIDTGIGKVTQGDLRGFVNLFHWSNPSAKDILQRLVNGEGSPWHIPKDIFEEYKKQLGAEIKKEMKDPRTGRLKYIWVRIRRDNHLFDCEAMQIVAAAMERIIGSLEPEEDSEDTKQVST